MPKKKYKLLNLGSGNSLDTEKHDCVRIDNDPNSKPDILWDLNKHPLPFKDKEFDAIYAIDVLAHLGRQGDYKFFFKEFNEYWRILKRLGLMFITVPTNKNIWLLAEPGHTRVLTPDTFAFLSQDFYKQVGIACVSDYRYLWKHNFNLAEFKKIDNDNRWQITLQKT